jgi:hypothetical protein
MFDMRTVKARRLSARLRWSAKAHGRLTIGIWLRFALMRLLLPAAAALLLVLLAWMLTIGTDSLLIGLVGTGLVFLSAVSVGASLLPRRGTAP